VDEVENVTGVAAESVEARDDQLIAGAQELQHGRELGAALRGWRLTPVQIG
jgi:hypothetical protein